MESAFIKGLCIVPFDAVSYARNLIIFVHVSNFLFAHLKRSNLTAHLKTEVESAVCVALVIDEHQSGS